MDNEYITIYEASRLTGKSIKTIHRYVKKGLLPVKTGYNHNKEVMTVEKEELLRVFKIDDKTGYDTSKPNDKTGYNPVITSQNLKETFREFLEEQKTQLLRPLEEQAIYLVGELRNEVKHLHAEKDTLRQENELLREQVKALPDLKTIQEKEKDLIIQIELERKEKEDLLSRAETIQQEQEEKHRRELSELETREKELHREEIEKMKKEAEKEKIEIVEAWQKKVTELEKPWYRRLFS